MCWEGEFHSCFFFFFHHLFDKTHNIQPFDENDWSIAQCTEAAASLQIAQLVQTKPY